MPFLGHLSSLFFSTSWLQHHKPLVEDEKFILYKFCAIISSLKLFHPCRKIAVDVKEKLIDFLCAFLSSWSALEGGSEKNFKAFGKLLTQFHVLLFFDNAAHTLLNLLTRVSWVRNYVKAQQRRSRNCVADKALFEVCLHYFAKALKI